MKVNCLLIVLYLSISLDVPTASGSKNITNLKHFPSKKLSGTPTTNAKKDGFNVKKEKHRMDKEYEDDEDDENDEDYEDEDDENDADDDEKGTDRDDDEDDADDDEDDEDDEDDADDDDGDNDNDDSDKDSDNDSDGNDSSDKLDKSDMSDTNDSSDNDNEDQDYEKDENANGHHDDEDDDESENRDSNSDNDDNRSDEDNDESGSSNNEENENNNKDDDDDDDDDGDDDDDDDDDDDNSENSNNDNDRKEVKNAKQKYNVKTKGKNQSSDSDEHDIQSTRAKKFESKGSNKKKDKSIELVIDDSGKKGRKMTKLQFLTKVKKVNKPNDLDAQSGLDKSQDVSDESNNSGGNSDSQDEYEKSDNRSNSNSQSESDKVSSGNDSDAQSESDKVSGGNDSDAQSDNDKVSSGNDSDAQSDNDKVSSGNDSDAQSDNDKDQNKSDETENTGSDSHSDNDKNQDESEEADSDFGDDQSSAEEDVKSKHSTEKKPSVSNIFKNKKTKGVKKIKNLEADSILEKSRRLRKKLGSKIVESITEIPSKVAQPIQQNIVDPVKNIAEKIVKSTKNQNEKSNTSVKSDITKVSKKYKIEPFHTPAYFPSSSNEQCSRMIDAIAKDQLQVVNSQLAKISDRQGDEACLKELLLMSISMQRTLVLQPIIRKYLETITASSRLAMEPIIMNGDVPPELVYSYLLSLDFDAEKKKAMLSKSLPLMNDAQFIEAFDFWTTKGNLDFSRQSISPEKDQLIQIYNQLKTGKPLVSTQKLNLGLSARSAFISVIQLTNPKNLIGQKSNIELLLKNVNLEEALILGYRNLLDVSMQVDEKNTKEFLKQKGQDLLERPTLPLPSFLSMLVHTDMPLSKLEQKMTLSSDAQFAIRLHKSLRASKPLDSPCKTQAIFDISKIITETEYKSRSSTVKGLFLAHILYITFGIHPDEQVSSYGTLRSDHEINLILQSYCEHVPMTKIINSSPDPALIEAQSK